MWHGQRRAAGLRVGSTALVYVPPDVLPRVDSGLERIEATDGTRPILWLSRMYLLQVRTTMKLQCKAGVIFFSVLAFFLPIRGLLQLIIALEADGWVGTRSSNWGRIIDELRCVWVAKCRLPFVEAGANPHEYDWR